MSAHALDASSIARRRGGLAGPRVLSLAQRFAKQHDARANSTLPIKRCWFSIFVISLQESTLRVRSYRPQLHAANGGGIPSMRVLIENPSTPQLPPTLAEPMCLPDGGRIDLLSALARTRFPGVHDKLSIALDTIPSHKACTIALVATTPIHKEYFVTCEGWIIVLHNTLYNLYFPNQGRDVVLSKLNYFFAVYFLMKFPSISQIPFFICLVFRRIFRGFLSYSYVYSESKRKAEIPNFFPRTFSYL